MKHDHKDLYGIYVRVGLLLSLVLFIMLFSFVPYATPQAYELKEEVVTMVERITAEIEKFEEPPPVERPRVAVEANNEVAQDIQETIAVTDYNEHIIKTVPTGPEIEIVPYYKVEVKPKPVYIPVPKYPLLALKAGIEGTTVVKALVDTDGSIREVKVLKSSGNQMLDQAALSAAKGARFTPAQQRDRYVRVWIAVPIKFNLKG